MKLASALMQILVAAAMLAFAGIAAPQGAYPAKPIRFITPYAPGGTTDIMTRILAERMTADWGQPVITDNRGGGNTIIGTDALAKATPDGYTILLTNSALVIIPNLLPTPYDVIKDLAPVAIVSRNEFLMAIHPSVPANDLKEFIAFAKSKPGQLNYGSAGTGSPNHLSGELLQSAAGIKMQHIPYKGGAPALAALVAGQIQAYFQGPLVIMSHIKAGKLKALAITGDTREPGLPQVPTFAAAGLPGVESNAWQGVLAPAGTPKVIIDKLAAQFARILTLPDVKERLDRRGMKPSFTAPDRFAALIKSDLAKFAKVIKAGNIKM